MPNRIPFLVRNEMLPCVSDKLFQFSSHSLNDMLKRLPNFIFCCGIRPSFNPIENSLNDRCQILGLDQRQPFGKFVGRFTDIDYIVRASVFLNSPPISRTRAIALEVTN